MSNINFVKKLLLFLFLITAINIQSQELLLKGYMSIGEPYNFNLPVFGISIPMPAKTGFVVPKMSGENIALEMDDNVDYYFPEEMLKTKNTFKFSLTGNDKSFMMMQMIPYAKDFDEVYLMEKARHSPNFVEPLTSIKNAMGKSVSYRSENNATKVDAHVFYHQGYMVAFMIQTDDTERAKYEKLIADLRIKEFRKERIRYENRVKSGYYSKSKREPLPDVEPKNEMRDIKEKNKHETRLDFALEGFSFVLPKDYVYSINARRMIDKGDGTTEVYRTPVDMLEGYFMTWFRGPQGSFMTRFTSKTKKDVRDHSNMADGAKQVYSYYKDFDLVIDGVKAGATFYGQPDAGTVEMWFENEKGYFSIMLSDVNNNTMDFYDKLLASIKIETQEKRLKYNKNKPLSSMLKLEDLAVENVGKFETSNALSLNFGAFRCDFAKVGATIFLPGKPAEYTWGIDNMWGKDVLKLNDIGQTQLAPTYKDIFLAIRTNQPDYQVDCTLYPTYGAKYTVKELLARYISTWKGVKREETYKEAGVFTAEDGSQWGVYVKASGSTAIIFGCNDNYSLYLDFSASSPENLQGMLALLHKFKINKNSPPLDE